METVSDGIKLRSLGYSRFLDEEEKEDTKGWDKQTINYILENKEKLMGYIVNELKHHKGLIADDIYSDLLEYAYTYEDYNLEKAMNYDENSKCRGIMSLESYVYNSILNCIKRAVRNAGKEFYNCVSTVYKHNNLELKAIDMVVQDCYTDLEVMEDDLEYCCKKLIHKRYWFGDDIFLVLYIELMVGNCVVFDILGINKRKLAEIQKRAKCDCDFMNLLKVCEGISKEEMIAEIRKYVYSADMLDIALSNI